VWSLSWGSGFEALALQCLHCSVPGGRTRDLSQEINGVRFFLMRADITFWLAQPFSRHPSGPTPSTHHQSAFTAVQAKVLTMTAPSVTQGLSRASQAKYDVGSGGGGGVAGGDGSGGLGGGTKASSGSASSARITACCLCWPARCGCVQLAMACNVQHKHAQEQLMRGLGSGIWCKVSA